jgi:chorismate-pyruvate lyase
MLENFCVTSIYPDNLDKLTGSLLWPLNLFCTVHSRVMPQITPLFDQQMPEPYKELLVHERNMTPTLENFHESTIYIERLNEVSSDEQTTREVILRLETDNKPVEYGASRIFLESLPPKAIEQINEGKIPLGTLLRTCDCRHTVELSGFFRLEATTFFSNIFPGKTFSTLYGRRNTLVAPNGKPIAEVCEVLPPLNGNGDIGVSL